MDQTFSVTNVQEGFKLSGLVPFEAEVILENVRGWSGLEDLKKAFLLELEPKIRDLARCVCPPKRRS